MDEIANSMLIDNYILNKIENNITQIKIKYTDILENNAIQQLDRIDIHMKKWDNTNKIEEIKYVHVKQEDITNENEIIYSFLDRNLFDTLAVYRFFDNNLRNRVIIVFKLSSNRRKIENIFLCN